MHFELISVEAGDRFGYEGQIKTAGDSKVSLSVQTYNEKMKVINWSYASKTVTAAENWVEILNEFEIPQDIKYLIFGSKGSGSVRAWIDNVVFNKLQVIVVSLIWRLPIINRLRQAPRTSFEKLFDIESSRQIFFGLFADP